MISKTAEYALRAAVALAEADGPVTITLLASTTEVPEDYLAKVMLSLARSGVVTSQKGRGGGFRLAKPAAQLTALDVVNAVDPIRRITHCPLGKAEHEPDLCPLHQALDQATASVEASLGSCVLESLKSKSV